MQTLDRHTSRKHFAALCRAQAELASFVDPTAVLTMLHDRGGNPEIKDRILAALVLEAQGDGIARDIATILLWLALWPGLDALHRHLRRHFAERPDELVSEITARFTAEVQRADLCRIRRVAATLIANVERDIRAGLRRRWDEVLQHEELRDEVSPFAGSCPAPSVIGLPAGIGTDAASALLRTLLLRLAGEDADILIATVLIGESQKEIAHRFGLSHVAIRKRHQRVIEKLQLELKNLRAPMSQTGGRTRFSLSEGQQRPTTTRGA